MKGLVFKELISMMEQEVGELTTEQIIAEANLDSKGAYTSVGTYDYNEALTIVTSLSKKTGLPINALVKSFGKYLLNSFFKTFPDYFENKKAVDFLKSVDSLIHVEVKKLTPDAELPELIFEAIDEKKFSLEYKSSKPFADLAEGLIEETFIHFKEPHSVTSLDKNDPCHRTFIMEPI